MGEIEETLGRVWTIEKLVSIMDTMRRRDAA